MKKGLSVEEMVQLEKIVQSTIKEYEEKTGEKVTGINYDYEKILNFYHGIILPCSMPRKGINYLSMKSSNGTAVILVEEEYAKLLKEKGFTFWNQFVIKRFVIMKDTDQFQKAPLGTFYEEGLDDTIPVSKAKVLKKK